MQWVTAPQPKFDCGLVIKTEGRKTCLDTNTQQASEDC